MVRWEYLVKKIIDLPHEDFQKELNELGKHQWELILREGPIYPGNYRYSVCTFKRPLTRIYTPPDSIVTEDEFGKVEVKIVENLENL